MYITQEKVVKSGFLAVILAVCIATIAVILNGINQFKLGSQLASINQVSNLSHLLVRQQANLFSLMLVKNTKNEDLLDTLDNFAKENFVLDATLYSPNGSLIVQSRQAQDLKKLLAENNGKTQQIVEPIFAQQNLVGFLRVTFDAQYGQTTKSKVEQLFNQLYGELIILVLIGGLIASSLNTVWKKRTLPTHIKSQIIPKLKSQAQRFHSRRRAFRRK